MREPNGGFNVNWLVPCHALANKLLVRSGPGCYNRNQHGVHGRRMHSFFGLSMACLFFMNSSVKSQR